MGVLKSDFSQVMLLAKKLYIIHNILYKWTNYCQDIQANNHFLFINFCIYVVVGINIIREEN